jgi:hypothetical protein
MVINRSDNSSAIAFILVLIMRSLKMVEWGVIVGSHPTITPHFYPLYVRNACSCDYPNDNSERSIRGTMMKSRI